MIDRFGSYWSRGEFHCKVNSFGPRGFSWGAVQQSNAWKDRSVRLALGEQLETVVWNWITVGIGSKERSRQDKRYAYTKWALGNFKWEPLMISSDLKFIWFLLKLHTFLVERERSIKFFIPLEKSSMIFFLSFLFWIKILSKDII